MMAQNLSALAGRKVLVTGAAGFVGRHLIGQLTQAGAASIVGLSRSPRLSPPGLTAHAIIDLGDPAAAYPLADIIRSYQPDLIFHLAGGPGATAAATLQSNGLGAAQLFDVLMREAPATEVVVLGSAAEYGQPAAGGVALLETDFCRPETSYGIAKHAQTLLALEAFRHGLRVTIARPFNLVGPGIPATLLPGAVLARVRDALIHGADFITVGNVESARDFITIDDAVRALIGLALLHRPGEIYNLCSGRPVLIRTVIEELLAQCPRPIRYVTDPGLRRAVDVSCVIGSQAKLRAALGFAPESDLASCLRATAQAALASL